MKNTQNKKNVAIILFPWASKAPYNFISDITKILAPTVNNMYVITGYVERLDNLENDVIVMDLKLGVHYAKSVKPIVWSYFSWIVKNILIQIKMALFLVKLYRKVDIVIFMAYPYYTFPLIFTKILKMESIELITRSKVNTNSILKQKFYALTDYIIYGLLSGVSPESELLISELDIDKNKLKILPICARYIDTNLFSVHKNISDRKNVIGYIGRLSKEKGFTEFINSIPLVAMENNDFEFLIVGDGDLFEWATTKCKQIELEYDITINFVEWVTKETMPSYLNDLKLLVLPSPSEGLPTIILEAMACGTPVLATSVGGIPDLIKDNENGFLLPNNSPECICKNVISILNKSELNKITENARKLIEMDFTYEAAVRRYKILIEEAT